MLSLMVRQLSGNDTYLFDSMVSSTTSRDIVRIIHIVNPRTVCGRTTNWPECEESEVAVGHVAVLGAEQKLSHERTI